ncbi:MAG: glucose-1-phosphate thymidylyltransferase [Planctomycetales bacterium]|nr:glucose-1-phosphate thymidylyltransferase [Planctomycetales bacterium]NIM09267.1 glucose-1-phosphate thymidylyltransferase [Planctomycetales bacterium]NIN08735.1 glucose-1-phosphate thymidylyltransferase [Planctomycetales bacterium]NIN77854.1 glucose-1-phosphate thymidylyltransferase [Planctomycetales bacterium]NIO35037.1 glucose-1-phosphate thymidylyltransferase [Planctomycetales bacterium]
MTIVLFEDERTWQLAPLAMARPAFDLLCGGMRLVHLVRQIDPKYRCLVRQHLRDLVDADFARAPRSSLPADKPTLFVNARLVPTAAVTGHLQALIAAGHTGKVVVDGQTAVAVTQTRTAEDLSQPDKLAAWLDSQSLAALKVELALFAYPHDLVARHLQITSDNLQHLVAGGEYRQDQDGVFLAGDARIGPYVVTDTQAGPIVLEPGVTIGSHCYLRGPIHLGEETVVVEQSSIKGPLAAGRQTKLGGEITASIIDSYSNTAHHGFLGHSCLGSWVNFGAGTTNSNLKNTYGEIHVEYEGHKVATGMQFLGCMVGDYAKTAINTAIFTGKTLGVASMLYGTVTANVPAFVNYAGGLGRATEVSVEAALKMQARMFSRRGRTARGCDAHVLQAVYQQTGDARRRWDPELDMGPPVFR